MPLAEFLEDSKPAPSVKDAPPPADAAAKMRKKVFLEFGAIIALGLALAGWYVGYRVLAARADQPPAPAPAQAPAPTPAIVVHTPVPVAPAKVAPQPTPASVESKVTEAPAVSAPPAKATTPKIVQPAKAPEPVKRKDSAVQPFKRRDANPRAGEKYLQIAAFGPRALDGFLRTLEGQGLHPVVAPGPVENIYRILVGPFPNAAALEETRSLIKASGIEPILRAY